MKNLILASQSPRRKEILTNMGFDFTVIPAENENNPTDYTTPSEFAEKSALYKAENVFSRVPSDSLVLAADTIVVLDSKILGKPADKADAFATLRALSGHTHEVYTGYALITKGKCLSSAERTLVTFRALTDSEILAYVESGEPMDKAGSYGIQGLGCKLVSSINGDYYNVMGLPAAKVYETIMGEFDVER